MKDNFYPIINIPYIENPNRLYAVPLLGFLIKIIALIPIWIFLFFLFIGEFFVTIINSFVVLFTGKYWKTAYSYNLGLIRFTAKSIYYFYGLTDKYPTFDLTTGGSFTLDIPYPENPNRLFAIPLAGGLVKVILLIPYFIYQQVLGNASFAGVFFSFAPVLFGGFYPESTFELARDSVRVSQGSTAYMMGLSDKYPSFSISMEHKTIKIILIIIGIFMTLSNFSSSFSKSKTEKEFNPPKFESNLPTT